MSTYKLRKKPIFVFFIILPIVAALLGGEIYIRFFRDYVTPEILKKQSFQYVPSLFSKVILPEKMQIINNIGSINYVINSKGYRGNNFPKKKIMEQ